MLGHTTTLSEIRRLHRAWAERDFFRYVSDIDDMRPKSIRQFIHQMALGNAVMRDSGQSDLATFPDLTDLNNTFGHFISQNVRTKTGDLVSIRGIVFDEFCESIVPDLAIGIACECEDEHVRNALFKEFGVKDWDKWRAALQKEVVTHEVAVTLLDDLLTLLKERTLFSFFVTESPENGFISWGPGAKSGVGRPLKTHRIDDHGLTVVVNVSRYEEYGGGEPVTAYEWSAELVDDKSAELPNAVACGMVYVFEREDGAPIGDRSDLLQAADSVADTDVLQVNSFLKQHEDAEALIEDSDLCFVWIWERRSDAEHGLGARCLKAAVSDLQKRFQRIRTVIIDTRPTQFVSWDMPQDPPMVQIAKQTAIESLVAHVEKINIPKVAVRHIFNHHEGDPLAALAALGADAIDRMAREDYHGDGDGGDRSAQGLFDWTEYADELAVLFEQAGLSALSERVDDLYASRDEIVRTLKHMVFHQRIPYLPASLSPNTDFDELFGTDGVPLQAALEDPDVEDFQKALPAGVVFREAHYQETSNDGGPGWIILVTATTKFCDLKEYFTLTPVPRPIDVSHLIKNRGRKKH